MPIGTEPSAPTSPEGKPPESSNAPAFKPTWQKYDEVLKKAEQDSIDWLDLRAAERAKAKQAPPPPPPPTT